MLLATQVKAFTVLNERTWCTGYAKCNGKVEVKQTSGAFIPEISKSDVILRDQQGYEGIEIGLGATHIFYIYNGTPADVIHILKANLCDMYNKCFYYEKTIRMGWKEVYSETVYSSVSLFRETIGKEPITAESEIEYSPTDRKQREAALLVAPFPYDH